MSILKLHDLDGNQILVGSDFIEFVTEMRVTDGRKERTARYIIMQSGKHFFPIRETYKEILDKIV